MENVTDDSHSVEIHIKKEKECFVVYLLDVKCQVCFQLNKKKKQIYLYIDDKLDEIS